ncbi:sugar ABC transporter substrate-binding protein [Paludibacterium paludis]|uniref:Sugar ABC transporter substrate-binding protein n=2 Tax=Paludibacterium paludis TaxID=1225769 RepID=A0A918U815_9NEIS|nr:sugar ABC transporter substrate-binding protein [Paludibacterium paludis]
MSLPLFAQSVLFINPGRSDEAFWVAASRAMKSAAASLGVSLEVIYAERDHVRTREIARNIIARPPSRRPEYVVLTNDYGTAPELLRAFDGSGIKTFLAYSGIDAPADRILTGRPRERYPDWLGSLEPDSEAAGYLTAKALFAQARAGHAAAIDGRLHLLAIGGDRSTPTSVSRNRGMRRAVVEAGDVTLEQEVYADWKRDKAAEKSDWLYRRYPRARLVWAGNDMMAFGAMKSWKNRGGTPGKDGFFSAVNTSDEAMRAVTQGQLAALAGGHFLAGAWSLVMLYDYAHGKDFRDEGLELERPMFMVFSAADAERYLARFGQGDFSRVDFRRFSRVLNPKRRHYAFGLRQLLDGHG